MKKTYKIEVDCINCAGKMERTVQNTPGVQAATVNFMTQKLVMEFAEGADEQAVMLAARKNCKKAVSDGEIFL